MYIFQHAFNVVFATKNKRVTNLVNMGNFIDASYFITTGIYLGIIYEVFRTNTWVYILSDDELGRVYWDNMMNSYVNENILLFVIGFIIWAKAFYQLKLISITGSQFAIMGKLLKSMVTFGIFYLSVLFLYAIVGFVLFSDIE